MTINRHSVTESIAIGTVLSCLASAVAGAQVVIGDARGFQQDRSYLALFPFESIDTSNGNVVLQFTDLKLPGNAGHDLTFDRVYNNHTVTGGGSHWTFGISGMPKSVTQKSIPSGASLNTFDENEYWAPSFSMADGSVMHAVFMATPNTADPTTLTWVMSPPFWKYNCSTRELYRPDGMVGVYEAIDDAPAKLVRIRDQFGNTIDLTRSSGLLTVTQSTGSTDAARVVSIAVDSSDNWTALQYGSRTWTYSYFPNSGGLISDVQPPEGQPWRFTYDAVTANQVSLLTVTAPQGGTITYGYDYTQVILLPDYTTPVSRHILTSRTVDSLDVSGTWNFRYLVLGAGMGVTGPTGTFTSYFYDPTGGGFLSDVHTYDHENGREVEREERSPTSVPFVRVWNGAELSQRKITRDGKIYLTTYSYDAASTANFANYHRPTVITETGPADEFSRTTTLSYRHFDAPGGTFLVGLPATEQTMMGGVTVSKSWAYDDTTGFRISDTSYGITTRYAPDAHGNVASITKGNGKQTTFAYRSGVLGAMTTPGTTMSRQVNADGTIAAETIGGRTTHFSNYDGLFRVRQTDPPLGNAITVAYDDVARTVTTHHGSSVVTTTTDGFGRPIRSENGQGSKRRQKYDALGRVQYASNPFTGQFGSSEDIGETMTFDALGRVTEQRHADQSATRVQYVANTTTIIDEGNRQTVRTTKSFGDPNSGRLTTLQDANGQSWSYTYDVIGHLTSVTAPDGITRRWTYDSAKPSLLTQETHPEPGAISYTLYDAAGMLKEKRDANGIVTTYTYDGDDRVICITAGSDVTTFTYESGSDNVLAITTSDAKTVFTYDPNGQMASRTDLMDDRAFNSQFAYDANGNLAEILYPSGRRVAYGYDSEDRLTSVRNPYTQEVYASGFAYQPGGALKRIEFSNGVATDLGFDPVMQRVVGVSANQLQLQYQYDAAGNVSSIVDSRPELSQTLTYDNLDRLTRSQSSVVTSIFDYDVHGNRVTGAGGTYSYAPGTFRLENVNGIGMTYDTAGNLKTGPQVTFAYRGNNLLASATVAGVTTNYGYDGAGSRIKKATNGAPVVYYLRGPGGQLLSEWTAVGTGPHVRDYVYAGGTVIAAVSATLPAQ